MTLDFLAEAALAALGNAYRVHEDLEESGLQAINKNQFGDTSLKADIQAEEAIIQTMKKESIPIRIVSEEHGVVNLSTAPTYLGVLDGLDGSSVYKDARGVGRYGTMFGIFSKLDPCYSDYLFSGIMEHSTGRLFYASKGKGSYILSDGNNKKIHSSRKIILDEAVRIYIDEFYLINRKVFSDKLLGYQCKYSGSSAVYYADLACGEADIVLECTRKKNLEIAVAYGLEAESGAGMFTLEGMDLGTKRYLEFGQDQHIPIVTASTRHLAEDLIKYIS